MSGVNGDTPLRIEPNPRWIRGTVGGRTVVDSRRVRFVWEIPHYPAWYVPVEDVRGELRANGDYRNSSCLAAGEMSATYTDNRAATTPGDGYYYRVRARDRDDVLLWIGISAITGAILFSNY